MAEFTNQASLIYNDTITNSNIVVGELVQSLAVAKTALRREYSPDGSITYVVSLTNKSGAAYTGLTVTDDLGAYDYDTGTLVPLRYVDGSLKYFLNGALQPTPAVDVGDTLNITGVSVPANGDALLIYEARPTAFAPLGADGTIINTASVNGDMLAETLSASETVSAQAAAWLSISKAISPSTVSPNGQVTYTFVIQNTGNTAADAALGAVVTDTFSPVLKDLTATFNGAALTLGADYTYDQTTGAFATLPGTILVDAATYTRNEATGAVEITPAVSVLTITGRI